MLEHQKTVLKNVSHDKELFKKELKKSVVWLQSHEVYKLYAWVKEHYGMSHRSEIKEVFALVAA
jgi:hypothetical protein